ncbi:hypothetical protein [Zobellia galactanivorans]|uniref:Uncharacterized protein n=1 Tax=Zobellia galactanivorans (strain DSM 12802 / CCUG 47099 / CIP 106680 / NCIMB 13871 / Dsij) TaxID=63186 RepID=G0L795_ZOBGA|nr:hypothetical protein [Zobellia galactanivorans]CAZ97239.1 Putative protein [Zobellia galactanivorans]
MKNIKHTEKYLWAWIVCSIFSLAYSVLVVYKLQLDKQLLQKESLDTSISDRVQKFDDVEDKLLFTPKK